MGGTATRRYGDSEDASGNASGGDCISGEAAIHDSLEGFALTFIRKSISAAKPRVMKAQGGALGIGQPMNLALKARLKCGG